MIIPVHGNDGSLVGVKVDETVTGGLTGELVRHHLDADYPRLSHHVHGILAGKKVNKFNMIICKRIQDEQNRAMTWWDTCKKASSM